MPSAWRWAAAWASPSLRLKGFFLSLTTIGFTEIVRLLASNLADVTGGTMGLSNIPHLSFFFAFADKNSYFYLNLIFTVILTLIAIHIVYSKWGRAYKRSATMSRRRRPTASTSPN